VRVACSVRRLYSLRGVELLLVLVLVPVRSLQEVVAVDVRGGELYLSSIGRPLLFEVDKVEVRLDDLGSLWLDVAVDLVLAVSSQAVPLSLPRIRQLLLVDTGGHRGHGDNRLLVPR
jgi:hypothetical protein